MKRQQRRSRTTSFTITILEDGHERNRVHGMEQYEAIIEQPAEPRRRNEHGDDEGDRSRS